MVTYQEIDNTNGIFQKVTDQYALRYNNTKLSKFHYVQNTDVYLMGCIQICRIKKNGEVKTPSDVWGTSDLSQGMKIATTNDDGWFLDVFNNTQVPLFQASYVLYAGTGETKLVPNVTEQVYKRDIIKLSDDSKKVSIGQNILPDDSDGEFLITKNTGSIILVDAIRLIEGYTYEFKTYSAIVIQGDDNLNLTFGDGLKWFITRGNKQIQTKLYPLLAEPRKDNDLMYCVDKYIEIQGLVRP